MDSLTETDMEMDTEIDTDIDTDIRQGDGQGHGHGIGILLPSIRITCDTSRRKFQQRYELVAPLPNENYDMLILKNSYHPWDSFPDDVLAELEIS
jgi:hypothetical protein